MKQLVKQHLLQKFGIDEAQLPDGHNLRSNGDLGEIKVAFGLVKYNDSC